MDMRLQLKVVGEPHKKATFLRCGTFSAKDLRHVMTQDELSKVFKGGAGIDLDFTTEKGFVHMQAEGSEPIHFNGAVMIPGQKYPLKLNEKGILKIGDLLLHAETLQSAFDLKHHQRQR